ncbi:MAG: 16S rRNA (cytosine(1402)-N(4))-methyltransferase RsmH [Patescibacteria group bacterium]|nr:16S rRNA (cytosine(1402)-N(4))-methyltransferase RsmH [Patescibacteria group bacterium]MDE1965718.1 16S rRNA (cytosine(1402)-N(4))-methyltransferase RsmH [Patescibacteria group bacterium]
MTDGHTSVFLAEAVDALAVAPSDIVVDATLGGAGHFARLLSVLGADGTLIGIDADADAVERARGALALDRRADRPVVHLLTDNFRNLSRIFDRLDLPRANKFLFDLGWSGFQLSSGKGFSFLADEPLLMTYGDADGETAADIVNGWSEQDLADLIFRYGEERYSRRIAASIVERRGKGHIVGTRELADAISAGVPASYRTHKIHPATKTFQALRIAVNDEFGALREGLAAALAHLAPGGRIAVITFHSAEDRIVKEAFRNALHEGTGELLFKKPLSPTREEVRANPRSRSAKLRVFIKSPAAPLAAGAPSYHTAYA